MNPGRDLRDYLALLDALPGEGVAHVSRRVDPVQELAAVVKKMEGRDNRPVLFENVIGSDMPVLMGLYGTKRRIGLSLGIDDHAAVVVDEFLRRLDRDTPTIYAESAPIRDSVQVGADADLADFPIGVHVPEQGGRYITAGVFLVRHPETRAINAGIYRVMVHDSRTISISIDPGHDAGKVFVWGREHRVDVEFAIVIGAHPALSVASQAKVPMTRDTYSVMGSLVGEPVEVIRAATVDIDVPTSAGIVIEGRVKADASLPEGPFGEFSYYYGSDPNAWVGEVTAIARRSDAIWADLHPTHTEHRALWLFPGREASLLSRLRQVVPTAKAAHLPLDGAGMVAWLSVAKAHQADGRRALLMALNADVYIKHAVVVDADVDVNDPAQVLWALAVRFQGDRDLVIIPGLRGYFEDPTAYAGPSGGPRDLTTKVGYDATLDYGPDNPARADQVIEELSELDPADYIDNPPGACYRP